MSTEEYRRGQGQASRGCYNASRGLGGNHEDLIDDTFYGAVELHGATHEWTLYPGFERLDEVAGGWVAISREAMLLHLERAGCAIEQNVRCMQDGHGIIVAGQHYRWHDPTKQA